MTAPRRAGRPAGIGKMPDDVAIDALLSYVRLGYTQHQVQAQLRSIGYDLSLSTVQNLLTGRTYKHLHEKLRDYDISFNNAPGSRTGPENPLNAALPPITYTPIGYVESAFAGYAPAAEMRARPSRIILRPELTPGLLGLAAGQSILVLFHLHRAAEYELQLHPGHNPENPVRGVFATRSQYRPNGIAVTVAEIRAIADNAITVIGLDAQDGSPALDIKPYAAGFDRPAGESGGG